jgi:hypothetical protein
LHKTLGSRANFFAGEIAPLTLQLRQAFAEIVS